MQRDGVALPAPPFVADRAGMSVAIPAAAQKTQRRIPVISGNTRHANSMKEQSRRILRDVRGLGEIAADNVGDVTDRIKARGRSALAKGRRTASRVQEQLLDVFAEHPVRSLLVAIGVGALLGLSMRRRS